MTPEPVSLAAEGLRRRFGAAGGFELSIDHIEVPAGTTQVVIGPSGSGKSTLLALLGLLDRPDSGRVLIGGAVADPRDREMRLRIAAVFQRPYLFKGTVGGNVAYGLAARGVPAAQRSARVSAALARVGMAGFEERSAMSLSGGEAQRVSLARALVLEPRVLLLDEPLASIDPLLKRRLTREFASILREAGVTALYVTHDHDEALVMADRVAIMNQGRIVAEGPAEEVMSLAAEEWTAEFLGIEPAARATVVGSEEGLIELSSGAASVFVTGAATPGAEVEFSVRPEDVLLFGADLEVPAGTARNRLEAVVIEVAPRGATHHVALDANGLRLAASVSRAAASELALAPGSRVTAVFKATAVRWRIV